jgi:hypothetical protein
MSIKTNYFDGHTYSAADDRRPWYSLMDDGVFGIATQALKVVASSPADLSVNVQPGACIVAGYYIYSDAVVNLPIIANTSGYNRVDIVVVEVDEVNKETDIRIVQGTPTSTPTAPLPNEQQYVLAEIFVGNNVSVIENSNITDRREEAMTKTLKTHQAEFANTPEIITNANGTAFKYPSGALVCWHTRNILYTDFPAGEYTITWTFPVPFLEGSRYFISYQLGVANLMDAGQIKVQTVARSATRAHDSATCFLILSGGLGSGASHEFFAIGRWK